VTQTTDTLPVGYLTRFSAAVLNREPPSEVPERVRQMPGDIILALSDGDFISFACRLPSGTRVVARMTLMGSQYADALQGCGTANGEGPTRRLKARRPPPPGPGVRSWPHSPLSFARQERSCSIGKRADQNLLLLGPPGVEKSRLARRLTTILPAMTLAEALETMCIHSVAGFTGDHTALTVANLGWAPP
jgi:Magnesium chelatase, subunit ChlI